MSDQDFISQFIDALSAAGCPPKKASDIKADDQWHRYTVSGDNKPNARYQLKIDGDFACGRFVYFKEGISHSWHSNLGQKMTREEREARRARIEADRVQNEIQQREEYKKVAQECLEIWRGAKEKAHPYLEKKGVSSSGTKVCSFDGYNGKRQTNVLIIPIYKNGRISSLQRIWPNGFKAFWEGGDVSGGYTALAEKDDDKSTIIITEGFATGKTIREAVGVPVVVAYNAGNLMAVSVEFRKKYPDSKIIIAADNDQWTFDNRKRPKDVTDTRKISGDDLAWGRWRREGILVNPGLKKAREAAVKIGAHVIFPDIPENDKHKNTDFNDLFYMRGIEAVKERLLIASPAIKQSENEVAPYDESSYEGNPSFDEGPPDYIYNVPAITDDDRVALQELYIYHEDDFQEQQPEEAKDHIDKNWEDDLVFGENGMVQTSLRNASMFIKNHEDYRGLFVYDEFSNRKMVVKCPPWEKNNKFNVRDLTDEDKTELAMHLEKKHLKISIQNISKILDSHIYSQKINPAKEYFKSLKWDGISRLPTWLNVYCGCINDDHEYLAAVGTKWVVAAVNRVMQPGCKFDHILILEGDPDLGKSSILRELATIHGKAYFDDGIRAKEMGSDKSIQKMRGVLIVELQEMTGFDKMDPNEAKQIISTQVDRIVEKYKNEPIDAPRKFVIAGTINPKEGGYLNDPTGNKRYWPVFCTKIETHEFKKIKEQLWAEAVHLYENGEEIFLTGKIKEIAAEMQKKRLATHPWQPEIENICRGKDMIPMDDLWSGLLITDRTKRNKDNSAIIGDIMMNLGFRYSRKMHAGQRKLAWWRKEKIQEDIFAYNEEEIVW